MPLAAALVAAVLALPAHAGETWLACTPIDDPVNGRRVFQQEPCPPGEAHIPLPPPRAAWPLRDTFPEPVDVWIPNSWPATGGTIGTPTGNSWRHQHNRFAGRGAAALVVLRAWRR